MAFPIIVKYHFR